MDRNNAIRVICRDARDISWEGAPLVYGLERIGDPEPDRPDSRRLTDAPVQRVNLHANTVCAHKMATLHRMRLQTDRTFHRFRTQAGGLVPSSIK